MIPKPTPTGRSKSPTIAPVSRVSVVRGAKGRDKVVRVEGVDAGALRERLLT